MVQEKLVVYYITLFAATPGISIGIRQTNLAHVIMPKLMAINSRNHNCFLMILILVFFLTVVDVWMNYKNHQKSAFSFSQAVVKTGKSFSSNKKDRLSFYNKIKLLQNTLLKVSSNPSTTSSTTLSTTPSTIPRTTKPTTSMNEKDFLQLIADTKQGLSKKSIDFDHTQICVTSDNCKTISEYIKVTANEYIADVNKHLRKNRKTPVLEIYTVRVCFHKIIFH